MNEQPKITIIEGPPPTFEAATEAWLLGLTEGLALSQVAVCRVRTANGPQLVERCYRAWRDGQSISLEYRAEDGLAQQAPIVAARWTEVPDGHVLLLWVRLEEAEIEVDLDFGGEDLDDDPDRSQDGGLESR
ncbi:MAG: hypothetical protein NTU91_08500 [Chloroflexi bacterium]|nr:hypothetical protein [Chloroflexota bacterium]